MAQTHSLDLEKSSSQYASIADGSQTGLDLSGDFSLEIWATIESLPSSGQFNQLIAKEDFSTGANRAYAFGIEESGGSYYLSCRINGNPFTQVIAGLVLNKFYHFALTRKSSDGELKFYLNGRLVGTTTGTTGSLNNSPAPFALGARFNSATPVDFWDGLIKEARVWDDIRTASEIQNNAGEELIGNESNLVGYWKLNNDYLDETSNNNDLTASGSPSFSSTVPYTNPATVAASSNLLASLVSFWRLNESSGTREDAYASNDLTDNNTVTSAAGIINDGADFERDNSEYLSISDGSQSGLDMTTSFSISAWLKLETTPGLTFEYIIASKYQETSSNRNYLFSYYNEGGTLKLSLLTNPTGGAGANVRISQAYTLSTGTLYHVAVSYNLSSGVAEFFVNGVSVGIVTGGATTLANGGAEFRLGSDVTNGSYMDGILDEVGIWAKALNYGEILDLYNAGVGITHPFAATSTLTETLTLTDSVLKIGSRILSETLSIADTVLKLGGKVLTEIITLYEWLVDRQGSGMKVAVGTYVGDGTDNRNITGVGFTPDFVFVKPVDTTANGGAMSWSGMGSDKSFDPTTTAAFVANMIQSFNSDGFQIGSSDNVNKNTVTYQYVAIQGSASHLKMGSYSGDGTDNRDISGIGFSSDLVIIKRDNTANAFFRMASMSGDNSGAWTAVAPVANRIQSIGSDGFQIGSNAAVNTTGTYHYICFKFPTGQGVAGSFAGNASDNRDITGLGFDPIFVWIKSNSTNDSVFRTSSHSGDASTVWQSAIADIANAIQGFGSGSFQVGTDARANNSGVNMFYIALRAEKQNYFEQLYETVTNTDIFASIKTQFKEVTETLTLTATLLNQAGRTLIETLTHTDTIVRTIQKVFTEVATFTDTCIRVLTREFTEIMTMTATSIQQASRTLTETLNFTDVFEFVRTQAREFTETITHSDVFEFVRTQTKELVETITHSDVITAASVIAREFTEALTLTATAIKSLSRTLTTEVLSLTDILTSTLTRWAKGFNLGRNKDTNTIIGQRNNPKVGRNNDTNIKNGTRLN